MIELQIAERYQPLIDEKALQESALAVLTHLGESLNSEATIAITGDAEIQILNEQYMGVDAPTDVLSFPAGETDPESGNTYLGDIMISYPQAAAQASQGGHSVIAELQLLVVHGMLHLLGFDHAEPEEKTAMWDAQDAILKRLGSPIKSPPA